MAIVIRDLEFQNDGTGFPGEVYRTPPLDAAGYTAMTIIASFSVPGSIEVRWYSKPTTLVFREILTVDQLSNGQYFTLPVKGKILEMLYHYDGGWINVVHVLGFQEAPLSDNAPTPVPSTGGGGAETFAFMSNDIKTGTGIKQNVIIPSFATHASIILIGGGGGGGSGCSNAAAGTATNGGWGGIAGSILFFNKIDLSLFTTFGAGYLSCDIGVGGTGGIAVTSATGIAGGDGGNTILYYPDDATATFVARGGMGGWGGITLYNSNTPLPSPLASYASTFIEYEMDASNHIITSFNDMYVNGISNYPIGVGNVIITENIDEWPQRFRVSYPKLRSTSGGFGSPIVNNGLNTKDGECCSEGCSYDGLSYTAANAAGYTMGHSYFVDSTGSALPEIFGTGGGGGYSSSLTVAAAGQNGGLYGGGGGGGSGTVSANTSGAGGNGANGCALFFFYRKL